jgi:hypothetical protein
MALSVVFALIALVIPCIADATSDTPVITVCQVMQNMSAYNGQTVVIIGRLAGSMEGSWLDADCPQQIVQNGIEWHTDIALAYIMTHNEPPPALSKGFDWNEQLLLKKVAELRPMTVLHAIPRLRYREEWAAVFGRFETHPLQSLADGFGHLNGSPARLIWPEHWVHILHVKAQRWVKP